MEAEPIELEGASIFSTLEGVFQQVLRPKRSRAALKWGNSPSIFTPLGLWVSASSPPSTVRIEEDAYMQYFSAEHPIIAIVIASAIIGAVLYKLSGRRRNGGGGLPGPYGNPYAEKFTPSGNRLD
jgi:hypothetical protein